MFVLLELSIEFIRNRCEFMVGLALEEIGLLVPQDPRSLGQIELCSGESDSPSQARQLVMVQRELEFPEVRDK
jgi:hypothetical protein